MSYSKEKVKEELEVDDIVAILDYFGGEPEDHDTYILSKTICHGGDSKKLYYYIDQELFHCYTDCSSSFDIFELVQKIKHIEFNDAVYFVVSFLNLQYKLEEVDDVEYSEDWKIFKRYEQAEEEKETALERILLPAFDLSVIEHYPRPRYSNWEKEGISKEVCDYCGIHYDPIGGNILIPHFDQHNRCVGIRQRTLVQENEQWGKYRPWKRNKTLYNHALAFNLYGLNWALPQIQESKIAIVTESEKAVLQYISYFGLANNLCVAVCGSSLSKYQFQLLQDCGVKEIVIAFDKDFEDINSEERVKVEEKLLKIYHKFGSMVNMSFLFDSECNTLGYKQSPLDAGKDKFLYLFRNRIVL